MALGNSQNKIYLSVADGKIVQRVKEGTPGSVARAKKDGVLVHELKYGFITGTLIGISTRTSQYQGGELKEWQFEITDGGENYLLSMMFDSRYATSFLFALCNPSVDLSQPITINPWMKVVDDKKRTACYLNQNGETIEWYFTKDNPRNLPDLVATKFKGKDVWDSFDRMVFLEAFVNQNVVPKLTKPVSIVAQGFDQLAPAYADPSAGNIIPEDDDLPF